MRVAASDLVHGLYVAELDRPWAEVPVMFQGFVIGDDEELQILQRHCKYVFVDPGRSREDAARSLEAADAEAEPEPEPSGRREGDGESSESFADARLPDKDAFRESLTEAKEHRNAAADFLDEALRGVQAGESLDAEGTRETVSELAAAVARNTTASLWLTNLRERDEYTTRHAINVCVLMLAFGVHYGFDRTELERLAMGALLMDVGMTRMPQELVNRPGPLTASGWAMMKGHTLAGVEIVKAAGYVPRETLEIIELHHERLDGSGYPHGLQGSQIPMHARLAGLFDTYDEMTRPRVSQDAMPPDRVLQQLHNEAEQTFGLALVQQFIRCVGVYPAGSLVELDNGAAAAVLGSRPDARSRPIVLLVRTPDGETYDKRVLLNLAADPEATGPAARSVRRVLDPVAEGIDVASIVAFEFGLG
ncbi:MAG: DUF3391 domain-containing protein [Halofilum sp. (in: g-proteobacteria)]|nr:DUF3391 domain-containing protein [Halofilum sp. (in: g-proteobacteria)]